MNSWTGGQYSLLRVVLGASLAAYFVSLAGTQPLAALAAVGSALLAAGAFDRPAAVATACLGGWVFARDPSLASPVFPFVLALLGVCALLPAAPYGAWAARGRADPDGGWRMPAVLHAAAWLLLLLACARAGVWKWSGSWLALATLAPLLALGAAGAWRPLRRWVWLALLAAWVQGVVVGRADAGPALLALFAFAFDPGWLPRAGGNATVFYDGACGLCHRAVRFLLAEDQEPAALRYAPIESERFNSAVPEASRADLPDSLILVTADGTLLTRSAGVLEIARRLGGVWRAGAALIGLVPAPALDALYDRVAAVRRHLFAAPDAACPLVPGHLRSRFE